VADLLRAVGVDPSTLSLHRRHGLDVPELVRLRSGSRTPTLSATRRIFTERLAIGGGNRALGRQDACGRAPRYSSGPNELGNLGCRILLGNKVPQALVNH
jgi:hypothetical protein